MNNIEHHEKLCDQIHTTYEKKNHDYGDSFGKSIAEHGYIAGVIRMEDKMNRIKSLIKNGGAHVKDESLCDTLLDLANYAIMLSMEIEKERRETNWDIKYIGGVDFNKENGESKKNEEHKKLYGRRAFEKAVNLYIEANDQFSGFSVQYCVFHTRLTLIGMSDTGLYNKICVLRPIGEDSLEDVEYFTTYLNYNI